MIYLDFAASSPLLSAVLEEMTAVSREIFANSSSLYTPAYAAKRILNESRAAFARALGAQSDEIVFSSGGTESNNLAIFGAARASRKGKHIVVGSVEHSSILAPARALEREGYALSFLPCDQNGRYKPAAVAAAIRPDTALVSLQLGNNETGVLQPIAEIGAITRAQRVVLHCDAVAAFGHVPIDIRALKVDLLSASAHKIGGPKGAGILFVRNEIPILPLFFGGAQERGLRPGTENVPAIAGFAKALSCQCAPADSAARDLLESLLCAAIPGARVNGADVSRLPNLLSITFPGVSGERLLQQLSAGGVYAAARAACASGAKEPSHVLTAMGLSRADADATIRFSTGHSTKLSDIAQAANVIDFAVQEQIRTRSTSLNN